MPSRPRKLPRKLPPKPSVVVKAHALRQQIAILDAQYEKLALEIKGAGPGIYGTPAARAIVSEYESRKINWPAVAKAAKVPPKLIAKHTKSKPVTRLDWSEPK